MILRGDIDRRTQDLDFFGLSGTDVQRLLPAAERALSDAGFHVRRVREAPAFVRLEVRKGGEKTELDLAADARLFPLQTDQEVPTLSSLELAVDKVLAVFGRAEARDFVDLSAIVGRFGLTRLVDLASQKDPGFSLEVFSQMLERFARLRPQEFDLSESRYQQLASEVSLWREQALELARTRGRDRRFDRGPGG